MGTLVAMWPELLITLVLAIVGGTIAAAVQNKSQGDDVRKSAKGGLAGGVVAGLFACVTIIAIKVTSGAVL